MQINEASAAGSITRLGSSRGTCESGDLLLESKKFKKEFFILISFKFFNWENLLTKIIQSRILRALPSSPVESARNARKRRRSTTIPPLKVINQRRLRGMSRRIKTSTSDSRKINQFTAILQCQ